MTMNKVNRFTFGTFLSVPLRPAAAACLLVLLFGAGAGETQSERRSSLRRFSAVQQLTRPPSLSLKAQTPGDTVYVPQLNLRGLLSHPLSHFASVSCNGEEISGSGLSFDCQVDLVEGTNQIAALALDQAGNQADAALTITYIPLPSVTITAPADGSIVNTPSIALSGSVDDDGAAVDINGAPATSGSFDTAVALHQGQNLIVVSATNSAGGVGTAHLTVTLDTTPPRVAFDSPAEGFVSRQPTLAVSGMVNDLVVGTVNAAQVRVEVNGVQAQVSNRCFLVENLPLQVGANTLDAVATDIAGNTASSTIEVFFDAGIGQAQIRNIEGSNQTGVAGSLLPGPLVTELVGADGNPLIDQPVLFRVMQNNGRLVGSQALGGRSLEVRTDAEGRAQAQWLLGGRVGTGNQRVEAVSPGVAGSARFFASGTAMPAAKINLDAGGNQVGRAGRPLADPLSVVVTDEGHNRLEGVRVDFSVVEGGGHFNGSRQLSVQTDSDGRALALLTLGNGDGIDNNRVEATFPGCPGLPAVFVATGRIPADPADTRISGTVLDHTDTPILGVTIRVDGTELQTTSDEQGQFVLQNATVGPVHLVADGSTARRSGDWPSLSYEMVSVAGQNNTLGMPIYLLPLDTPNGIRVGPETGGVLSLPDIPGFALDIAAGSATFLDGSDRGLVSVTAVHADKIPMEPNFGQQPRFVVTIQPAGVLFDPPAKLTLPNTDGLAPGEVTDLYSFDHDLGQFVSIGTGTVSADGTVIASDPGGGVAKGGWHCGGNPQTTGGAEKVHVRVDDCAPDCGGTDIKILRLEPGENGAIVATGGPDPGTYTWRVTDSEALTLSGSGDSAQLTKNTAGPSKVTVRYTCRSGAWAEEDVLVLSEGDQYVGLDPNQHCEIDESGDQSIVVFHQNKILNLEAHAVPANGTYSWKVIDERPDPGFDTLIVGLGPVLVPGNTPSCTNRPDCGAVFDTRHPGRAKVEVTFTPADGSPAVTASREIIVLKLEVEKMWSDQIPNVGAVSNFLPGGAGKQGNCDASCYILMGTRADGGLYAQASLRATPDILSKISRKLIVRLAALPDDGGTNLLVTGNANRAKGFDTQAISAGTLPQTIVQVTGGVGYPVGRGGLRGENAVLVFDNPGFVASTDYTIAAGLDINKDGILNKDEIIQGRVDFFCEAGKQTPLFKVITKGSYLTQVTLAEGGQFFSSVGLTIAPTVLDAFLDDNDPGSGRLFGTDSGLISFDETIPGGASSPLDHNVGVIYNSSGQGTIRFHQWTVGSEVSNTILKSATFNSALKLYLLRKSQTVRDFFIANPGATSNTFTWNDFSISQSWNSNDEKDLFFAFGASTTTATLSATVRASDLELTSLGIGGKTVDLYDWNYEKPVSIAGAEIVRLVAIQAGYNTLGKGGHIFRIQVDLTETRNAGAVLYDHIRDEDGDVDEVVTTSFDFK